MKSTALAEATVMLPQVKDTLITKLRELKNDLERGRHCLGLAEKYRHNYLTGQQAQQELLIHQWRTANRVEPTSAQLRVMRAQGNANWGRSVEASDCKALEAMYGRWADNYHAAYTASQMALFVELLSKS